MVSKDAVDGVLIDVPDEFEESLRVIEMRDELRVCRLVD